MDWVPPTAFGLDNSVRLYDALQEAEREGGGNQSNADDPSKLRILTKFGDIKNKTTKEIQDKIQRDLTGPETSDDDEDDEDEDDRADDDSSSASSAGGSYSFGSTSGSKLVDKLRVKAHKAKVLAGNGSNTPSGSMTGGASSFSSPAGTFTTGASSSFGSFPSQNSSFGGGFPIASNPFGSSISSFGSSSLTSNPFGNDSAGLSNGSNVFGTVATLSAGSSGDVNRMAASSLGPSTGSVGASTGELSGFPAGGMGSSASAFGASFGISSSSFANPFVSSSTLSAFPVSSVFDASSIQSNSPLQSQSLSNSWSGNQSVGHSQALPPPYPAPSDTSYRAGKNILSTESPSWMSPDTVSSDWKTDSDVKTTGFDNLKSIEKVITHDSSLDAINHKSTTGVALLCATVLKYEDEKRTWIRRSQPLPVDWTLDAEDKKLPTFKPGSTRDKDWTQKDAALGKGVENSYNVPITYESQQAQIQREQFEENSDFNPSHEPPLRGSPHSVPKRSAIKLSNTSSSLTTSNQQSSLMLSNARKTVQFGGVIVKTFVTPVYDYSESNVAPPLPPRPQLAPVSSDFTSSVPASATLPTGNDLMGEGGVTNNHVELHTGFEQQPAEDAVDANDDEQEVNQEDDGEGDDYEDDEDSDE